jgi:hypothetical protein
LCDQTFRGCVGSVTDKIECESVVEFLRQVVFRVVGDVLFSRDVFEAGLVLADAVADPVEPHINSLAAFLLDCVVC